MSGQEYSRELEREIIASRSITEKLHVLTAVENSHEGPITKYPKREDWSY